MLTLYTPALVQSQRENFRATAQTVGSVRPQRFEFRLGQNRLGGNGALLVTQVKERPNIRHSPDNVRVTETRNLHFLLRLRRRPQRTESSPC